MLRSRPARALAPAALLLAGLAQALPAAAQTRPLRTEAATTAERGSLGLEVGFDAIADEPNYLTGLERTRLDLPIFRLTGSPAGNVQLDLEWVGRVMALDDPDFGDVSDWGDVTLRAKWRFAEPREGRSALAARFSVTLPETSFGDGLGPNTLRMSAQLLATTRVGSARLHLNAGLAIQDDPLRAHEQRDFLHYGVALELPVGGSLEAVAEIAGFAGNGAPGADERGELRAGFRYGSGAVRVDAAVRRGLQDADGTWGGTAGFTWRIR
jgi:hypothetical protein